MSHTIKTLYIVHHSHTDIGYTDLQERIITAQIEHIRDAVAMSERPENKEFRWTCETLYCVEQFLKEASNDERQRFFKLIRENRMGISANYLNFNDLADYGVLSRRLKKLLAEFSSNDIQIKTAMTADINGISMGQRDAMLENGVEFLFTNIHTHHGMYPLYQNQNAYWWENAKKQRLLVWNGEHYNLGNALGLKSNPIVYGMDKNYFGGEWISDAVDLFHQHLDFYLTECENSGYKYDFIVTSVSGVFSDNAPPCDEIMRIIEKHRESYGEEIHLQMVSLQELYAEIAENLADAPVYHGDLNDWWANGVGSTPYAVKHYRAAQRMLRLAQKLSPEAVLEHEDELNAAEDNLLLYAEHTWGHSATITNPYETLVTDLDIRKTSYASKAHEAAARLRDRAAKKLGAAFNYYAVNGRVRAVNSGDTEACLPVEFYVETSAMKNVCVKNSSGKVMKTQISAHPRGVLISFTDKFAPNETKEYTYTDIAAPVKTVNTRHAYVGAELVQDIINDYSQVKYRLPYCLENKWFKISYEIGKGFTSLWNKRANCEMLKDGDAKFFTPIYERTRVRKDVYDERRLIGRNIRGLHAEKFIGELVDIEAIDVGEVFTTLRFIFRLEGTVHTSVIIKLYNDLPRIDFTLRIGKTLSSDIESVYMPLALNMPKSEVWLEKGTEPFRPGVDQLPGTCMEYWMSDIGAAYKSDAGAAIVYTPDTALIYAGEMKHHQILLCDNKPQNNSRDIYSWVMNNTWETNFKMDLSGFGEYSYRLELSDNTSTADIFNEMKQKENGVYTYHVK